MRRSRALRLAEALESMPAGGSVNIAEAAREVLSPLAVTPWDSRRTAGRLELTDAQRRHLFEADGRSPRQVAWRLRDLVSEADRLFPVTDNGERSEPRANA